MKKTITTVLAVLALALSVSAQEPTKKAVSAEFAKAANLALVAIKNSDNTGMGPDKTVQTAINDADAAGISDSETAVVKEIKFLSVMRPVTLSTFLLATNTAAADKAVPCAKKHPDCHANDANDSASKALDKDKKDLEQIDGCIAAWRVALRSLSGDKPKECETSK
jgi:hypothetical protein